MAKAPARSRTTRKPFKSNLEPYLNRPLPPGVASRAFRVQTSVEALDRFAALRPDERGDLLTQAFGLPAGERTTDPEPLETK